MERKIHRRGAIRVVPRAVTVGLALVLAPLVLAGCPGVDLSSLGGLLGGGVNIGGNNNPSTQLTLRDVVAGRQFPSIPSANVRVEIQNLSGRDARTRLTLRVGGKRVHFTSRTILAGGRDVVVGPDKADAILFEAELAGETALTLPSETRFLNTDFRNGDTVRFVIAALVQNDCDENGVDDSLQSDRDGDGAIDACDGCPDDANKRSPGACGCGVVDNDADQDGTPDCADACPNDPAKTSPGACGCGTPDVDHDGDGTPDCRDECPDDPFKTGPGACGCGVVDSDENENGIIDCVEPQQLSIELLGIDADRVVREGTPVQFQVRVLNAGRGAEVRSFAKQSAVEGAPENSILLEVSEGLLFDAVFNTGKLGPGAYDVFAEVRDGARSAERKAIGRVIINAPPSLIFDGPLPEQLATRRVPFTVSWAGLDPDDAALIDIFVDTNGALDGDEVYVRRDVPANNLEDREALIDAIALGLPADNYFVGGTIRDALGEVTAYGNRVCLRERLVGRVPIEALRSGVTRVDGDPTSREFGVSIDAGADVDGDGGADLLVGDPANVGSIDVSLPAAKGGRAFYFSSEDRSPPTLGSIGAWQPAQVYVEPQTGARLGESVAFVPWPDYEGLGGGDYYRTRVALGAPRWNAEAAPAAGRAYVLEPLLGKGTTVDLCCLSNSDAEIYRGDRFDFLGSEITALGDVTGDGVPDFAIGGARVTDRGYVAIVSGAGEPRRLTDDQDIADRAFILRGESLSGYFGARIRAVPDIDGDGRDELLISEPFGGAPFLPRNGRAYLVFGANRLGAPGSEDIESNELRVVRIFGEGLDDAAGFSLATGDFDGDEQADLLIGSPLAAEGAGRAYLVYELRNYTGGDSPNSIHLADVGSKGISGARFIGQPGERLGYSITSLGDFDGDRRDDFAIGGPEGRSNAGVVRIIYGGERLGGDFTFDVFECGFETAELSQGLIGRGRMGAALAAGDVNGDGAPDLVTGAPTADAVGGTVFVVDGTPFED